MSENGTPPHGVHRLLLAARLHHRRWADARELAHAITGTVVGAPRWPPPSLHGTLAETVVAVLVTVAVYWAAEHYADVLSLFRVTSGGVLGSGG